MKKLLIICCFFLVVPAKAQNNLPVTYFNRTYDADTTIEGFASAIPLKDGYIAAGILGFNPPINKHATAMRKYDLKGNIVLEKVFEMDNYSRFMYGGSSFIQTKSGNFTMVFNITIPVYGDQVRIIHFTEAGDTLWSKTYGDTADQVPYTIIETSDKGYFVAGWQQIGFEYTNMYALKIDSIGGFEWKNTYALKSDSDVILEHSAGFGCVETKDGGFLISGYGYKGNKFDYQMYVVKTDALGKEQWHNHYGGAFNETGALLYQSKPNTCFVFGSSYIDINEDYKPDITVLRVIVIDLLNKGVELSNKTYKMGDYIGMTSTPTKANQNEIIMAGIVLDKKNNAGWGAIIIKYDLALKDTVWVQKHHSEDIYYDDEYLRDVRPTPDGGFIAAGFVLTAPQQSWLIKTDSLGQTCSFVGCDSLIIKNCLGYYTLPQLSFNTYHIDNGIVLFNNLSQQVYTDEPGGGHYLWQFGDGTEQISNSNESVIHTYPTNEGSYTATLNAILCGDTTKLSQTVQLWAVGCQPISQHAAPTNINEVLVLKPNPATNMVQCKFLQYNPAQQNTTLLLYNTQGVVVKKVVLTNTETAFSVTDLPKGVYYAHLPDYAYFYKLIVQ
jgi:hypothetical protein